MRRPPRACSSFPRRLNILSVCALGILVCLHLVSMRIEDVLWYGIWVETRARGETDANLVGWSKGWGISPENQFESMQDTDLRTPSSENWAGRTRDWW